MIHIDYCDQPMLLVSKHVLTAPHISYTNCTTHNIYADCIVHNTLAIKPTTYYCTCTSVLWSTVCHANDDHTYCILNIPHDIQVMLIINWQNNHPSTKILYMFILPFIQVNVWNSDLYFNETYKKAYSV